MLLRKFVLAWTGRSSEYGESLPCEDDDEDMEERERERERQPFDETVPQIAALTLF
jgi:hypothetical protein